MSSESPEINPYEAPQRREILKEPTQPLPPLPLALKAVAWLTIAHGVISVGNNIHSILRPGFPQVGLGFLFIPAGIGLLKLRRGWRITMLLWIWTLLISIPVSIGLASMRQESIDNWFLSFQMPHQPEGLRLTCSLLMLFFVIWQFHVLTRPDVKALFGARKPSEAS